MTPVEDSDGAGRDLPRAERFEVAYRRLYAPISGYVLRRLTSAEEAAEVVAETFLTLWRRLDDAPEGDALRPWTYGIARRVLANHVRGERRREALNERLVADFAQITQGLRDPADKVVEASYLRAALARLSEHDQELLTLVAWEGLSNDEIAISLGVRVAAVRLRLFRARRRLQAAIGEESPMKQDTSRGQVTEHWEDTADSRLAEGAS